MSEIYLLCEDDEHTYGAFEVLSYGVDKERLEAVALKMCWDDYEKRKGATSYRVMSPDECDYRKFYVMGPVGPATGK